MLLHSLLLHRWRAPWRQCQQTQAPSQQQRTCHAAPAAESCLRQKSHRGEEQQRQQQVVGGWQQRQQQHMRQQQWQLHPLEPPNENKSAVEGILQLGETDQAASSRLPNQDIIVGSSIIAGDYCRQDHRQQRPQPLCRRTSSSPTTARETVTLYRLRVQLRPLQLVPPAAAEQRSRPHWRTSHPEQRQPL